MDWFGVLGTVLGSTIASAIVAVVTSNVMLRSKMDRLEATSEQRVKDWVTWRASLEERLNIRANHLADHEKECRERWEKLLTEHGGVMERLRSIDEQLRGGRRR